MEMASRPVDKKEGINTRFWAWLKVLPGRLMAKPVKFAEKTKKLAQDDPRRIIHSLKVGLAITLVSLFYYFEPLYDGFGVSAMWAVMTVVVVFEFSVGATLSKGLNRGLATILAAALGYGTHCLAMLPGEKGEPILIGFFVFLLAAGVTFLRFFPRMKARYDYGLLVFILTFCLISVSGYRDDEVLDMATSRVSTIFIGGSTAMFVCIIIRPAWAGDDLHNLVAGNIESLANFLEGFGPEFCKRSRDGETNKTLLEGYKRVLNSKQTEESLANFASWEPGHGQFRFRHPWKQYLKIGCLTRHCACRIEALNGYLNTEIQVRTNAPQIPRDILEKIQEPCLSLTSESLQALKELAFGMDTMTTPHTVKSHIKKSKIAATNLKSLLNTCLCMETDILDVIPIVSMASLLVDVVSCIEKIAESVQELASLAKFKNTKAEKAPSRTNSRISEPEHVITIHQPSSIAD